MGETEREQDCVWYDKRDKDRETQWERQRGNKIVCGMIREIKIGRHSGRDREGTRLCVVWGERERKIGRDRGETEREKDCVWYDEGESDKDRKRQVERQRRNE